MRISDCSSDVCSSDLFFLADHVVMGDKVLPGAAYLEMARAAVELASTDTGTTGIRLKNVVWARPFIVGDQPVSLHIGLRAEQDRRIAYRIYSKDRKSTRLNSSH